MLWYYLLHLQQIQRQMVTAQANFSTLSVCYRMKDTKDEAEKVDMSKKLTRIDKVREE
jgi:hypothetical protein